MDISQLIEYTKKLDDSRFTEQVNLVLISSNNSFFTFRANNKYIVLINNKDFKNCKVHCDCIDFKYTYAYANFKNNCLEGNKPESYHKKSNRQSRNPMQLPGCCKHLIKCIDKIKLKL